MELRRYELTTLAAARRLRSSYCMLAHGSVLLDNELLEPDELRAVATDHRTAGLDAAEVAVMDLAEKVAGDATSITRDDMDPPRRSGCRIGDPRRRARRRGPLLHEQDDRCARRAA